MFITQNHIIALVIFLLFSTLYSTTAYSIYQAFFYDPSPYAQGASIALVSLILTIKTWLNSNKNYPVTLNISGLLFVLILSLSWFIAGLAFVEILQQVIFVLILISILITLYGHSRAKFYYIPIAVLILGLPIWHIFVPFLQNTTTASVLFLLKITGVPSYSEGIYIHIPEGTFKIATLCAGMRYQVAYVMLTIAYLHWHNKKLITYPFVIAFACLFAFLSNQLRVFIVILAGHLTDMQHYFVTTDHVTLGWVIFGITFYIFFTILSRINDKFIPINNQSNVDIKADYPFPGYNFRQTFSFFVLCIFLVSGPILTEFYNSDINIPIQQTSHSKIDIIGWKTLSHDIEDREPIWIKGDLYYTAEYLNNDLRKVDLFISHYYRQNNEREAISISNRAYDPHKWETLKKQSLKITLPNNKIINLNEILVTENIRLSKTDRNSAKSRIIWLWFKIGDKTTPSPYIGKLYNLYNILKGNSEITVYILSTDFDGDETRSRKLLENFANHVSDIDIKSPLN